MNFLTILEVTVILCSFRFVLDGKTVKEIPESSRLEFLEKFSANDFASSDVEDNTSGLLNRGSIADLTLLRTLLAICQKSWEPSFWEVMDSFVLLAYVSLAASRTLLQWLLVCINLNFDSEDLFCWYKRKKFYENLKTMVAAQAAENHGDQWFLTWCLRWGWYTSVPTWTNSQNSLAATEALSLKIFSRVLARPYLMTLCIISQSMWISQLHLGVLIHSVKKAVIHRKKMDFFNVTWENFIF